jgi:hypothetical protein
MRKSIVAAALVGALLGVSAADAGVISQANQQSAPSGTWLAWGGETRIHLNPDALDRFGITIEAVQGASARTVGASGKRYEVDTFPAQNSSALQINHTGKAVDGLGGGALRHTGGLVLKVGGKQIDLRGFSLQANAPTKVGMALADAAGTVWFTTDHAHPGFARDNPNIFSMREMNLRLSRAFAQALGDPSLEGYQVGGLDFRAQSKPDDTATPAGGVCNAPWPGEGLTTDIELVYRDGNNNWDGHDDSIMVQRCSLNSDGVAPCTASSTTGGVVIDQDSSLVNVGQTAVAWYYRLSGDFPPYNNDQHPFLIWNLYRLNADGSIKQIGVSGVKHAFETVNYVCGCGDGNVIYPTCEDTYAVYNNDTSQFLGPRSEIIPYPGIWGRCDSFLDSNCDGNEDDGGIAQNLYDYRMVVKESDMLPPLATGARYFFEYWYVIRDDQNIYNSMGYREIKPVKQTMGTFGNTSTGGWSIQMVDNVPDGNNFRLGPVLNMWVDPAALAPNSDNEELATPLGHARVAVKATDLGDGTWRYQYAIANFDYSHTQIDPAHPDEPNIKVDSNHGFSKFNVPVGADATITNVRFDDADIDATNEWSSTTDGNGVTWTMPAGQNSLDWGHLYRFEFTANKPPAKAAGSVHLTGIATDSEAEIPYDVALLVPQGIDDTVFKNGFEGTN